MKLFHFIICLALLGVLLWINQTLVTEQTLTYGGLSWIGWVSILAIGLLAGFVTVFKDSTRAIGFFKARSDDGRATSTVRTLTSAELKELGLDKYRGPAYPHPVIFAERCIGCQACVDACPHDVLAIVDGTASAVAPDLCMEDTACQAECPVNPKACIVINTAKEVRSLPTPTRDGASYETNVPGCYIIGDVSGVPLIKNAVKEGSEVIGRIAAELTSATPEPKADYDVAIIGIGPGGASAAAAAKMANLRYVGIERGTTLSTIERYPKGKYIFFKPDTNNWTGGIPVMGLGLSKAKYGDDQGDANQAVLDAIGDDPIAVIKERTSALHREMIENIPASLQNELSQKLFEKIEKELKKRTAAFIASKGSGDWAALYRTHFLPERENLIAGFSSEIADQLQKKIPGDQRENILDVWLGSLRDNGVVINEDEICSAVTRGEDGDYFVVNTKRGKAETPQTYRTRRVIIAIGLLGAPNKLRLPNEDLKAVIDGAEEQKVIYGLSEPLKYRGKHLIVVGGGNVAVEAAVDLVCTRDGNAISHRKPEDMNKVTMLVRDYLAPTVKFGNKLQLYQCADEGLIDLRFGEGIKEMRENECVIENVVTKQETGTIANDYIFALIGGERPNRFLESIGIEIK